MILTQTLYSKVSSLVAQRESQALEETMALAHSVSKLAHGRGVELEGILEVWKADIENQRNPVTFLPELINQFPLPLLSSHGAGLWRNTRLFADSSRLWRAACPLWAWWRRQRRDWWKESASTRQETSHAHTHTHKTH